VRISREERYGICLNFKFRQIYIIWISDDIDLVLVNDHNKIIGFKTKEALDNYLKKTGLDALINTATYECHTLQQWLTNPHINIDYNEFLNFWNLCTNISESLNIPFSGDKKDEVRNLVYDKLFNGTGIFISDDPNPVWSNDELTLLSAVVQDGFGLLLNNLSIQE
jgi:hypothetical protein